VEFAKVGGSSMGPARYVIVPLLTWVLLLASSVHAVVPPPASGTDPEPPTPPRQSAPWTPVPSKLPPKLISAASHLFQVGLGDPRGCEYREIVLARRGSVASPLSLPEGRDKTLDCHGWVLPATAPHDQRFAICWSGVVVPVARIGEPASLRGDVLQAIKADQRQLLFLQCIR